MFQHRFDNLLSRADIGLGFQASLALPVPERINSVPRLSDPLHPVPILPHDETLGIERALGLWERLIQAFETFARQFDLSELGDIELPSPGTSEAEQANLQALAPLYLAAALEDTRLLVAVEALAGVFISGGLRTDLGAATALLTEFWRNRRNRFTQGERQALFARLFGTTRGPALATSERVNRNFDNLMIDLTEALANRDETGWTAGGDVQLRLAARQLAANLLARNSGFATMATHDLLADVKTAIAILKHSSVQQAVGAHSVWTAVREIARRYLHEEMEIGDHLTRGKAGMLVLTWLAENLSRLDGYGGSMLVQSGDPVVSAAIAWLQASLSLAEQSAVPTARAAQQTR
jgi:hypothetical protein